MVDETQSGGGSAASICPWCSAEYTGVRETCPSCGAALAADPATDPALPGLTAIDTAAIVRAKTPVARPRNRLLSWISGEYPDEVTTAAAGALALPDAEVRREMLRLELEAEVANLQAEADSLLSEAAAEGRVPETALSASALVDAGIDAEPDVEAQAVPATPAAPPAPVPAFPESPPAATDAAAPSEPQDQGPRPA